jgi:hypothetical protein
MTLAHSPSAHTQPGSDGSGSDLLPIGQAEFDQLSNDLFWKFYAGEDGFVRWVGYDDANWWDKVSTEAHVRTRVGKKTGRNFVLDHATGVVSVLTTPANSVGTPEGVNQK